MLSLSPILFRCNSKRMSVRLNSCTQSGYFYLTQISPLKAKHRMALRKHDPVVNRHVLVSIGKSVILYRVFYQTCIATSRLHKTPASEHSTKYARLVGKTRNMRPLMSRIQRAYEYGRYNPFDSVYKRLVDSRGRVCPRMS